MGPGVQAENPLVPARRTDKCCKTASLHEGEPKVPTLLHIQKMACCSAGPAAGLASHGVPPTNTLKHCSVEHILPQRSPAARCLQITGNCCVDHFLFTTPLLHWEVLARYFCRPWGLLRRGRSLGCRSLVLLRTYLHTETGPQNSAELNLRTYLSGQSMCRAHAPRGSGQCGRTPAAGCSASPWQ